MSEERCKKPTDCTQWARWVTYMISQNEWDNNLDCKDYCKVQVWSYFAKKGRCPEHKLIGILITSLKEYIYINKGLS